MSVRVNRIKKCQSRKHNFGGCGDPKCPEGLSIKAALDTAVKNGDLDAFFTVKEQSNLKVSGLYGTWGWGDLHVSEPTTGRSANVKVKLNRSEFVEATRAIDKTIIPSFNSLSEFRAWVDGTYGFGVYYDLVEYKTADNAYFGRPDMGMDVISVAQIIVDADIQGMGISNHLKTALVKYADEHNVILSGTPTNSGDGKLQEGQEGWVENALAHRARLERSYQKFGYIKNPCASRRYNSVDYLTREKSKYDWAGSRKFTEKAEYFLREQGDWIRFPKETIPPKFLAKKPRPAPFWANDDDED